MAVSRVILTELWIICIFLKGSTVTTKCGYRPLNISQVSIGNRIDHHKSNSKHLRNSFSNFRLHFELTDSFESYPDFFKIQYEVLEPAKARLESIIKVKRPVNGKFIVMRECINNSYIYNHLGDRACAKGCRKKTTCDGYEVPKMFLRKCFEILNNTFVETGEEGRGVIDADFVLLVEVDKCKEGISSFSASCFHEVGSDRPVLGVLVLCKGKILPEKDIHYNRLLIQHQIIHSLGFSVDKFAFYRFQNGNPIVPRDKHNIPNLGINKALNVFKWNDRIAKEVLRKRSSVHGTHPKIVYTVTLPTVLEIGRKHFNCSTLDGVDLQLYPSISHFDAYFLHNEMMTQTLNGSANELTKFTLAFLKDTGWYDADFSQADDYLYGKNKGCNFILEGCNRYMNDQKINKNPIAPFCDKKYTFGNVYKCSKNRKYFHFCNIVKHKTLEKKYQYFTDLNGVNATEVPFHGGNHTENEFCPTMQGLENSRSVCTQVFSTPIEEQHNIVKSYYGADSVCFENEIVNGSSKEYYGASCQRYEFNKRKNEVSIFFEEKTILCPTKKPIYFQTKSNYTVKFTCPNVSEFEKTLKMHANSPKLIISGSIAVLGVLVSRFGVHTM